MVRAERTCKVGSYRPNALGLYDMHGNVWEWCDDLENPGDAASNRVYRGGSWQDGSAYCRAAGRHAHPPSFSDNNRGSPGPSSRRPNGPLNRTDIFPPGGLTHVSYAPSRPY